MSFLDDDRRLPPLEGGRNFRDLGGYAAAGGRRVRWGKLFRSGVMSGLTPRDQSYLDELGIAVICDLRCTAERTKAPNPWTSPSVVAVDYEMQTAALAALLGEASGPDAVRARMMGGYERLPYVHLENYRRLFQALAESDRPLVFNCTAGKDRTGVAAALILTLLGVPRETILYDYSLSEKVVDYRRLASSTAYGIGFEAVAAVSAEMRAPLLRSDPDYLQAAFSSIERQDGSVAGYLSAKLGVDEAQAASLRERLLESAEA